MIRRREFNIMSSLLVTLCLLIFPVSQVHAGDMKKLVKECEDCHGKNGNSELNDSPSIAGISVAYFKESMKGYAAKTRPAKKLKDKKENMYDVVKELSDEDKVALGDHFAKEKFKAFKQSSDAGKAAAGKKIHRKYCDKCHSKGATSSEDDAGILAGQPKGYLMYSMKNYASGKRQMGKKMEKKFKKMYEKEGDAGLENLVEYYASRK